MAICSISTLLLRTDDDDGEAATFATSATLCAPASKKCRAAHPRMNVAPGSHHRCFVVEFGVVTFWFVEPPLDTLIVPWNDIGLFVCPTLPKPLKKIS
jgi:hypothetical protein